jgi:hypothetical protein
MTEADAIAAFMAKKGVTVCAPSTKASQEADERKRKRAQWAAERAAVAKRHHDNFEDED